MRSLLLLGCCVLATPLLGREQGAAPAVTLEFRIVANTKDEEEAIAAATAYLTTARDAQKKRAEIGDPPLTPPDLKSSKAPAYAWARITPASLPDFNLDDAAEKDEQRGGDWREVAAARAKGEAATLQRPTCRVLVFSRPSARAGAKFEYFLLLRAMTLEQTLGPQHIERVGVGSDADKNPCIDITLTKAGGERFRALTGANTERHLAIVYGGDILSTPIIKSAIGARVQISGKFTKQAVEKMVAALRGGKSG